MNRLTKSIVHGSVASLALLGSFAVAGTAFAANNPRGFDAELHSTPRMMVMGTVATAPDTSGTFTVTSKMWPIGNRTATTTTTYTIQTASTTIVKKGGADSSVSAIAVGDRVMVRGTISGTSVTATIIRDVIDGVSPDQQRPPVIQGNGDPVVGGTITAISGSTVTITNKSNVTYTINASNATVSKRGVTDATISTLAVGDAVIVQGTVNGTAVTATSINDAGAHTTIPGHGMPPRGILGLLGHFFSNFFGFF